MTNPKLIDTTVADIEVTLPNGEVIQPLIDIFKGTPHKVATFDKPHPTTPAYDPEYYFDPELWIKMVCYVRVKENRTNQPGLMSVGLPGTGKSKAWRQFAAITNRPFFETTGRIDLDLFEVTGRFTPSFNEKTGQPDLRYLEGPLTQALQMEYSIFLFEEFDRCAPEVTVNFNPILDGYGFTNNDLGHTFQIPKGFLFIQTGNGNGQGDQSGLCHTSQLIDYSTMDRNEIIEHQYLPVDAQVNLLRQWLTAYNPVTKKTQCAINDSLINAIVNFGVSLRDSFSQGNESVPVPFTMRTLKSFSHQILAFPQGFKQKGDKRWRDWIDQAFVNKFASIHGQETQAFKEAIYEIGETHDLTALSTPPAPGK